MYPPSFSPTFGGEPRSFGFRFRELTAWFLFSCLVLFVFCCNAAREKQKATGTFRLQIQDCARLAMHMEVGTIHSGDSGRRLSLLPVPLDKFWGDEGDDLDSWLFHVTSVTT